MKKKVWTADEVDWAKAYLAKKKMVDQVFAGEPHEFDAYLAEAAPGQRTKVLNALGAWRKRNDKAAPSGGGVDPDSLSVEELLRLLERKGYQHGVCYLPECNNSMEGKRPHALYCCKQHKKLAHYRRQHGLPRDGINRKRCVTPGCYVSIDHRPNQARFCEKCIRDHERANSRRQQARIKAEREAARLSL